MEYRGALIAVRDIERSKAFYLELFGQEVTEDYGWNVVLTGGLSLQQEFAWLADLPAESVMVRSHNMEVYFEADDFDDFIKRLKIRDDILYVHPPKTQGWQQRTVRIYDPDGHIVEIGEPMARVAQRLFREGKTREDIATVTQQSLAFVQEALRQAQPDAAAPKPRDQTEE